MLRLGNSASPSFRKNRDLRPSATSTTLLLGIRITFSHAVRRPTRQPSSWLPPGEAGGIAGLMRILLTNDDGVNAAGLKVLETIARRFSDDIWIVAPTEEQSGA